MVLIYASHITPRLHYITNFLLETLYQIPFELTSNLENFNHYGGIKLAYSEQAQADALHLKPGTHLLFEDTIYPQEISTGAFGGYTTLFTVKEADWPFDIFAASFYLISRYEEYLPHDKDGLGRFSFKNSIAYKKDFLKQPVIQNWMQVWLKQLENRFPSLHQHIQQPAFTYQPTYDIDMAYSYLHKGWLRNAGGMFKDIMSGKSISQRIDVLRGKTKDPFDSYEWLDELHTNANVHPHYFILMARQRSQFDKNISPMHKAMQQLIKEISSRYQIGIHPSWQSGDQTILLQQEISTLQNIVNQNITSSRQHYIRLSLPVTYHHLLQNGIAYDYSMGYPDADGFRASVAHPFYWYDLSKDECTALKVFPFACMDATAWYYQHLTPEDTLKQWQYYYQTIKAVHGTFITIAHNTFYGTDKHLFRGWKENYAVAVKSFK